MRQCLDLYVSLVCRLHREYIIASSSSSFFFLGGGGGGGAGFCSCRFVFFSFCSCLFPFFFFPFFSLCLFVLFSVVC